MPNRSKPRITLRFLICQEKMSRKRMKLYSSRTRVAGLLPSQCVFQAGQARARYREAAYPTAVCQNNPLQLPYKLSPRKQILLDFFIVFAFTAMLVRPYFKVKFRFSWKWRSVLPPALR